MRSLAIVMLLVVMAAHSALAQQDAAEESISGSPEAQIEALRQQLDELRREYSERISELERKIEELGAPAKEDEEAAIRRAAEEAARPAEEEEPAEPAASETVFKSGALALQALNPEISVTGDFVSWYGSPEDDVRRSDFGMRVLGVHFESYLDPYSKLKACVPVVENGTELGEAYLTRYDLGKNMNLTLGKFHQQLGVVNRWHVPSLDQVDFPLVLSQMLGGPLESIGVSLDWSAAGSGSGSRGIVFQLTNGRNERVFGQNASNFPSALLRCSSYRDLTKDKYLELGLTALAGRNDQWPVDQGTGVLSQNRRLWTWMLGADLTLLWEPTEAMRYRNWLWRSEAYYLRKNILAPDGSGKDSLSAWGFYSYFQSKISRTTEIGARIDYYEPDVKSYADMPGLSLTPLAVTASGAHQWQIAPYLTWWQSEWVKWRIQYNRCWARGLPDDNRLILQCTFAAGPHKHERY